jgi:hypothetical protein
MLLAPSPFPSEEIHTTTPHLLAAQHLLVQALHFIIHKRPDHCCTVDNIQVLFKLFFPEVESYSECLLATTVFFFFSCLTILIIVRFPFLRTNLKSGFLSR